MKKLKNAVVLLLILSFLLTMLAACGSSDTTEESEEETTEETTAAEETEESEEAEETAEEETVEEAEEVAEAEEETEEAAAAEEAEAAEEEEAVEETAASITYPIQDAPTDTLTMWIACAPFIYNNLEDIDQYANILVYQEAEAATGIHLDITAVTTLTQDEKYALMCASGSMTDIMPSSSSYTGGTDAAIDEGVLYALTMDMLEENMPDYVAAVLSDEDNLKYVTSDNGNMTDILGPTIPTPTGAIIRQDWLDELGLDTPVTYDDYYEVLTAFKVAYDIEQPIMFTSSGIPGGDALTSGYGTGAYGSDMGTGYDDSFYYEDGEVKFGLVEEGFQEYLIMVNQWYAEGLIGVDFVSQSTSQVEQVTSAIASGETGIWYGGSDYFASDYIAAYDDPDFDPAPLADPVLNEGDQLHTGTKGSGKGVTSGTLWAIGANCEYVELALQYINYFFTEEGQWLCNYGVEGYSYTLDEDGNVVYTELVTNPDGITAFSAKYLYTSWGVPFVEFTNRFDSLYTTEEQLTLGDVWNSNRDTEWVIRGSLNTDESTEFSAKFADINTYCQSAVVQFIIGDLDPETDFDAFVQTCYDMGLQECLDLKQAAEERYYDR